MKIKIISQQCGHTMKIEWGTCVECMSSDIPIRKISSQLKNNFSWFCERHRYFRHFTIKSTSALHIMQYNLKRVGSILTH